MITGVMMNATTPPAITTASTAGARPPVRTTIKAQYKGHETLEPEFVVVAKSEDTATIVVMERMLASIVLPPAENATNYSWTQDKSMYRMKILETSKNSRFSILCIQS